MDKKRTAQGIAFAILAAALYAVSAPFSKLLLAHIPATLMAGFLYIGAGIGMAAVAFIRKIGGAKKEESRFSAGEIPFVIGMIVLDIAAPVCLMIGLEHTTAANASLLNNFEIVATALIALFVFKESISPRLWAGIAFVTASCALLSFEDISSIRFSEGSLLVLLAAVCWGLENNCTRRISGKDPLKIVLLKGIFSGTGSLIIGFCIGERAEQPQYIPAVLILGFVAYGLSIFFYVYAQRLLGAARTSAYYAVAPFIAAALSLAVLGEKPAPTYFAAIILMAAGAFFASGDKPLLKKRA